MTNLLFRVATICSILRRAVLKGDRALERVTSGVAYVYLVLFHFDGVRMSAGDALIDFRHLNTQDVTSITKNSRITIRRSMYFAVSFRLRCAMMRATTSEELVVEQLLITNVCLIRSSAVVGEVHSDGIISALLVDSNRITSPSIVIIDATIRHRFPITISVVHCHGLITTYTRHRFIAYFLQGRMTRLINSRARIRAVISSGVFRRVLQSSAFDV